MASDKQHGHMILADEFIKLNMSDAFKEMFFVVIQLGQLWRLSCCTSISSIPYHPARPFRKKGDFSLWFKVAVACIPEQSVSLWTTK
jgi:undecaprenyl-diphosphatase